MSRETFYRSPGRHVMIKIPGADLNPEGPFWACTEPKCNAKAYSREGALKHEQRWADLKYQRR